VIAGKHCCQSGFEKDFDVIGTKIIGRKSRIYSKFEDSGAVLLQLFEYRTSKKNPFSFYYNCLKYS